MRRGSYLPLIGLIILALSCQTFARGDIAPEEIVEEPAEAETITAAPTAIALIATSTLVPPTQPGATIARASTATPRASNTPTKTGTPIATRTATLTPRPNPTATRTTTPTATRLAPTPTPTASATKPPSVIKNVVTAIGVDLGTGAPINPTTTFSRNAVVHAIVALQNAPAQTILKAAWFTVDVGTAAPPNTLLATPIEWITEAGEVFVDFTHGPIPIAGLYRVDIFTNNILQHAIRFSVQ
ncbi:MAG: hypothetical protein HZC40_05890 [Chloroflexi bacterium]|nr:hypothetical protein [Chloroflexota bacterium]